MARPPQDPKIKMDEILDVVEPLFAAKGYRKTTISDIAKELGGARGLLYYYFKSKEEILEALINRQISKLLTDVKNMVSSAEIIPSRKIEIMVNAVFRTAQREDGLFLEFLSDEKNYHFKNKIFRQATLLLKPWLLRIIEEGVSKQYFRVSHLPAALTFIMSIILCLGDTLCEKTPNEELGYHLVLAASLIERALGMPEKTLHLSLSIA